MSKLPELFDLASTLVGGKRWLAHITDPLKFDLWPFFDRLRGDPRFDALLED